MRGIIIAAVAVFAAAVARADDRPASAISLADNFGGRPAILAVTDDGRVFQTERSVDASSWSEWASSFPQGVARFVAAQSANGRLMGFAILNGQMVIRAQPAADQNFAPGNLQQQGSGLTSLAVATDELNRLVAFAVAKDGTLWGLRQLGPGAWSALTLIGGHDLAGGASGPLSGFVVRPNALAATLGYGGVVSAFAIGGDGALYFATQPNVQALPSVWSGLGGSRLVDVTALTVAGKAVVIAQDADGTLVSRSQTPTGAWRPWKPAFTGPARSWTAVPDGFGGAFLFVTTAQGVVDLVLGPDGVWKVGNYYTEGLGVPVGAIAPMGTIGATVGADHAITLAALDNSGAVFSRPLMATRQGLNFVGDWSRIGKVVVTPNPPDFAAQAVGCFLGSDEIGDLLSGVNAAVAQSPDLAALADPVRSHAACASGNASQSIGLWFGREPSPSAFPSGLLTSGGDRGLRVLALRITRSGLDRMLAQIWQTLPKRQHVGDGYDVVLHSAKWSFGKDSLAIDLKGDFGLGKLPIGVTVDVKAVMDIGADGRPECVVKTTADSTALQIASGFFAPVAGNLGFEDYFDSNAGKVSSQAGLVCDLAYALPTDVLLPAVSGKPLQKLVFTYDQLAIDDTTGLTVYSGDVPSQQNRNPRVQWFALKGKVDGVPKGHAAFEFVAGAADMNQPQFSWSSTWPGAVITPEDGERVVRIDFPNLAKVKSGQPLNMLILSATDSDGQSASQSTPLVLTNAMLSGHPPKDASDVPDPRLPR